MARTKGHIKTRYNWYAFCKKDTNRKIRRVTKLSRISGEGKLIYVEATWIKTIPVAKYRYWMD